MDKRTREVCEEPRFWFGYLIIGHGKINHSFDQELLTEALGTDESKSLSWWHDFDGWYEGVFDEADGQVENPGILEVAIGASLSIRIEAHPGDLYYHLKKSPKESVMVANIGPHWSLPGFTVGRLMQMVADSKADHPFSELLSAPITWLRKGDDVTRAALMIEEAWVSSRLISRAFAKKFAAEWARCNDARDITKSWALPGAPIDIDEGETGHR